MLTFLNSSVYLESNNEQYIEMSTCTNMPSNGLVIRFLMWYLLRENISFLECGPINYKVLKSQELVDYIDHHINLKSGCFFLKGRKEWTDRPVGLYNNLRNCMWFVHPHTWTDHCLKYCTYNKPIPKFTCQHTPELV